MSQVTVDIDDLERIIYAASAVKQIEGTLASFKRDPFVKPHLDFTDAQKRLETAWRNAKRASAGTLVNFDEPLTDDELDTLRSIADADDPWIEITPKQKLPEPGQAMSVYDRLAAKGCVEMGQLVGGVLWPGEEYPRLGRDMTRYPVRLTDRGHAKLRLYPVSA